MKIILRNKRSGISKMQPNIYTVRNPLWALSGIALIIALSIRSIIDHYINMAANGIVLGLCVSIAIIGFTGRSIKQSVLKNDLLIFLGLPILYALLCFPVWGASFPNEYIRIVFLLLFVSISRYLPINRIAINMIFILFFIVFGISIVGMARGQYMGIHGAMRLDVFLDHPNPFGLFCVMSAALCFWKFQNNKSWLSFFFGFGLIGLFFQVFNGGASIFVGTYIYLYLTERYGKKWILFSIIAIPLILFCLYCGSSKFAMRINEFISLGILPKHGYPETSFQWRLFMWWHVLSNWIHSPLIGFGPGSSKNLYGEVETGVAGGTFVAGDPHNELLRILYEFGLIGFIIVIIMVIHFLRLNKSPFGKFIILSFISAACFDNFYRSSILVCFAIYYARIGDYIAGHMVPVKTINQSEIAAKDELKK